MNPLQTLSNFGTETQAAIYRMSFAEFYQNLSRTIEGVDPWYVMNNGRSYSADRTSVRFPTVLEMRNLCSADEIERRVEILTCGNKVTIKWAPGFDGYKVLEEAREAKRVKEQEEMEAWMDLAVQPKAPAISEQKSFTVTGAALCSKGMKLTINFLGNVDSQKRKDLTFERTNTPNEWKRKKTVLTIRPDGKIHLKNKKQDFSFQNKTGYVGIGRFAVKISDLFTHMVYKK